MPTFTGIATQQSATILPYPSVLCQPTTVNALWPTHSTNAVKDATGSIPATETGASTQAYAESTLTSHDMVALPSSSSQGTLDNPLIPKRRRRTSPEELAVLEQFFSDCPLPTQAQRAQLASKVGMTGRALQVWFQNRRQKEKKETNQYNPGSSAASSTGSATDPDQDAADLENLPFAFSSSPPIPASQNQPLQHITSKPAPPAFNAASDSLYTGLPVNKENLAKLTPVSQTSQKSAESPLPSPPISAGSASKPAFAPSSYTYQYSYSAPPINSIPVYETDLPKDGQPRAQAAPTAVIAAKKHVRKRPLGSHAPLARKPSLPHTFNFPDSPPHKRSERLSTERPALRRAASAASICSRASNGGAATESRSLPGNFLTQSMGDGSDVNRARVWVDALGDAQSLASPALSPIDSMEQKGASQGAAADATPSTAPDVTVAASATSPSTRRGFMTRDEVWQHMASDAPSSPAGPPALTRRAVLAHTATSEAHSALDSAAYRRSHARLQHQQSDLYGSASASSAATLMSAALEGSRAGGEAACALSALERKRARLVGHSEDISGASLGRASAPIRAAASVKSASTASVGPAAPKRRKSANGGNVPVERKKRSAASSAAATSKARVVSTSKRATKAKVQSRQDIVESQPRSYASSVMDDACSTSSLSSMGDLSFSSTSTAVSTLVGTPSDGPAPFGSYFPKVHARASSDVRHQKMATSTTVATDEDDERECAELLLGLGGFF